jgi:hypothetical protein
MLECVFTLDYELYGDGTGSLQKLVYDPTEILRGVFRKWNAQFVAFVEAAEFEKIEAAGSDPAIDSVKRQIAGLYQDGCEIALHLHPQWYNGHYADGKWRLDYGEYNLCLLPRPRIVQIVDAALAYLRYVLNRSEFIPLSFRAGNWLFQPTHTAASVLAEKGIRLDSSVFKGGMQKKYQLDYRRSLRNGYYWRFGPDVNEPDLNGAWTEVPVYTEMVPVWKMPTKKRLGMGNGIGMAGQSGQDKLNRAVDLLRWRYPLKLDFCRMTVDELTSMVGRVIQEDRKDPSIYRPLVAIGHTKDLVDPQTVDTFLSFLRTNGIPISTFEAIYPKLRSRAHA